MIDYIQTLIYICTGSIAHFLWNQLFYKIQTKLIESDANATKVSFYTATRKPIVFAIWATTILLGLDTLEPIIGLSVQQKLANWPSLVFFGTFLAIAQRWVAKYQSICEKGDRSTNISAMSKVLSAVIVLIIGMTLLDAAGVDYTNILTLGGFGTIVIGFAGREILSNMLSSIALHSEKHINIGDYVKTKDGIKGTITKIGWQATTIMTPEQTPIYVPNAQLTQQALENVSRNSHRNEKFHWTFKIMQVDAIVTFCNEADAYLAKLSCVDQNKPTVCLINDINERGVQVFINFNLRTHDWEMSKRQRHQIAYHLMTIAQSVGAEYSVLSGFIDTGVQDASITTVLENG